MSSTLSVSEARASFPRLLDRVVAGEEVTITRHGQAIAVVVRPDTLGVRRASEALAGAGAVRDLLERGRRTPLTERATMTVKGAEALLSEVRAGRSVQ